MKTFLSELSMPFGDFILYGKTLFKISKPQSTQREVIYFNLFIEKRSLATITQEQARTLLVTKSASSFLSALSMPFGYGVLCGEQALIP